MSEPVALNYHLSAYFYEIAVDMGYMCDMLFAF